MSERLEAISQFVRSLVRPIVTFGLVGVVAGMAWTGRLDEGFTEMMTLATAVVAFWFASRPQRGREEGKKAEAQTKVDHMTIDLAEAQAEVTKWDDYLKEIDK